MSRFLQALQGSNRGRPPFWMMRQAGRYLSDYQNIRQKHRLIDMFHNPEVIVEVTRMPLRCLPVDAAILFADILSVLDGLGMRWDFDEGPKVETDLANLAPQDPNRVYTHTRQAVVQLKKELSVPLIGFAGGPFTIASYIIEGGSSRDFLKTKTFLYSTPEKMHALLETITQATIEYLRVQIDAGVEAIQLFDSWAGMLEVSAFRAFCLPYLEKIVHAVPLPTILFCRGSCLFAEELAALKPAAISLDWSMPMQAMRKRLGESVALQGNLDPAVLFGSKASIQAEAEKILDGMEGDPKFIFNLGHGILPGTPFENVAFLAEYVTSR